MRTLALLFLFLSTVSKAELANNIPEYTRGIIQSIQRGGESCGIRFETAPPNLQTPADYIAVNRAGFIVAHILDRAGGFAIKHPLGGNVHWIEYSWEWFKVATPQGTVAHANRYTTGHGWQYNYYCRSVMVGPEQFDRCVLQGFTQVVIQRLCAAG